MVGTLVEHWEKIALAITPILTWIFKTRVYDKLDLKQKEISVQSSGAKAMSESLDFYKDVIADIRHQHEVALDRKNREIEKILKKQLKPIKDLKHHRLFYVCNQVERKVESIKFISHGIEDEVKTLLMNILIQEKLKTVRNIFSKFLDDERLSSYSGNILKSKMARSLQDLVSQYNCLSQEIFEEIGISREDAKYLIDSYEEYRMPLVNGFLDSLDDICSNDDYSSNYDKLNATYELISLSIYLIPKDVKDALDSVNGRFVKYKEMVEI